MKRDFRDWLLGFSTSFGITFLGMMVVLGTVCFVSYSRAQNREQERMEAAALHREPDTYLPGAEDRLKIGRAHV